MRFLKRMIALVLALSLCVGMVPAAAYAKQNDANTTVNNDIDIKGNNGFGTLLSKKMQQHQRSEAQAQKDYTEGYCVSDLTVSGNTATVEYCALEDAVLTVAIYSEDGLQLITSATAEVSAEDTVAELTLEGQLPEYFMASAFLMDSYDFSPLCAEYATSMYTREMQELLKSTVDDYPAELVLNLDDKKDTNFAVYAEGVKIIGASAGVNEVVHEDHDTQTYIIANADEQFTSLAVGDVFSYNYADNEYLIVKIASISVDGTTVTITGSDLEMEEVFTHVKIEMDSSDAEITVDDSTAAPGIKFEGFEDTPQTFAWEGGGKMDETLNFSLGEVETKNGIKASGSLSLKVGSEVDFYIAWSRQHFKFKVDVTLTIKGVLEAGTEGVLDEAKVPVGYFALIYPGVTIDFTPELVLALSGKVTVEAAVSATYGVQYETDTGLIKIENKPVWDVMKLEAEVTLFFGIDLSPEVMIIDDDVASIELGATAGLVMTAKVGLGISGIPEKKAPESRHLCELCVSFEMKLQLEIKGEAKLLNCERLSVSLELGLWTKPLGFMYYSIDNDELGLGTCPNVEYRLTINTVNTRGVPKAAGILTQDGEPLGVTNDNGTLVIYVPAGTYKLKAELVELEAKDTIRVTGATKLKLVLRERTSSGTGGSSPNSGIGGVLGNVSSEDYVDRGRVTATGKCGQSAYWDLYSDGTLRIHGTGEVDTSAVRTWYGLQSEIVNLIVDDGIESFQTSVFHELKKVTSVEIAGSVSSIPGSAFVGKYNLETVKLGEGVSSIGSFAFNGCSALKEITLPDSITRIEDSAFLGCKALVNLELPESLDTIGNDAFMNCAGPTSLVIPDGVDEIGNRAFAECKNLESITFGNSVVTIGKDAFRNCVKLADIDFGKGKIDIGVSAFYGCDGLVSVTIDGGSITIGESAFSWCDNLQSVVIGKGVTSIGDKAFYYCPKLTNLEIQPGVTSIGAEAFYSSGVTNVTIPSSVCSIGEGAFKQSGLQTVVMEAKITDIPASLFENCYKLTSAKLPAGLKTIGNSAFRSCNALAEIEIPKGVTTIGDSAFWGCPLKELTIPDGVVSIGKDAFASCYYVSSIAIPASVESIGPGAFAGISGLEEFRVDSENPNYSADAVGALLNKDGTVLIQVPGKMSGIYTIPEGVTTIGDSAISSCRYLTAIEIPNTVTTIGNSAFIACQELTEIRLPEGVTQIGASAFQNCIKLASISIPDGVTEIREDTFYGCTSLTTVDFGAGLTIIGDNAFRDCARIKDLSFPAGLGRIGSYAFYSARGLSTIEFNGDAPTIGTQAFRVTGVIGAVGYYPAGNETWTEDVMAACGKNITWYAYTRDENGDRVTAEAAAVMGIAEEFADEVENTESATEPATENTTETEPVGKDAPELYAIHPGEYETEENSSYDLKKASFTGLVPGEDYILLALASLDVENPLSADNLLYIAQGTAENDGTLKFQYVLPKNAGASYVMACGPSNRNLKDAAITFPEMYEDSEFQTVTPTVTYGGKVLTEGVDYKITGDTCFSEAGTYSCTITGMYQYAGSVTCDYMVKTDDCSHTGGSATCCERAICDICGRRYGELDAEGHLFENGTCTRCGEKGVTQIPGDIDGNETVDVDDVLALLWYVLFPEDYPIEAEADFDGNSAVDVDDVLALLWHVLFPDDYPLEA